MIVIFPEHQQCNVNLQKGHSGGSGLAVSPMIKSTKDVEWEKRIGAGNWNCLPSPSGGSFRLIGLGSQNPLFPSRGRILSPPTLREEIFFYLSTTSSFLLGIIFPFSKIIFPRSKGFKSWKIR